MARSIFIIFSLLLILISAASATDHIVGGHLGWNPNINYTLWSSNQTFYVDDLISFRYLKNQYNVFEVNKTGYDNCTMDGLAGNWSSGKDFILLDKPNTYYFICGNGYCTSGMKVAVTVHRLPSNASAPDHSSSSRSSVKSDGVDLRPAVVGFALAAVVGSIVGLGSGLI